MGATSFYALPFPDPGSTVDVPRDIKALADKLELWKNGFTVPSGNIIAGSFTDTGGRVLSARKLEGGVPMESLMYVMTGGATGIVLLKNSVEVARIRLGDDMSLMVGIGGGLYRPVPFAMYAARVDISVSNATSGNLTINLPTGRFTTTPAICVNPFSSPAQNFACMTFGNSPTSVQVTARHLDNAVSTATVSVWLIACQMTPTATQGFAATDVDDSLILRVATCRTDGCENADVPIDTLSTEECPIVCGPCGQPIDDVVGASKRKKR